MAHGETAALAAAETARQAFEERSQAAAGLPSVDISRNRIAGGIAVYELLREAGLATSNGEARRLIGNRGAKSNDAVIEGEADRISASTHQRGWRDQTFGGKKRHVLVRPV